MLKLSIPSRRGIISISRLYSSACEEVRIPVPWGHVAGKWWGPQDKRPILATHGWLDNAGSFDTLVPLLPKTSSFLAIDLPGCGYSSKLPPGAFYHFIDFVILIRRIVKYFNWEKVSFLGHSMGAMLNYVYSMLYPAEIEFLICLDGFSPPTQDAALIDRVRKAIIKFLKYDYINSLNEEPPSYSYEEMEQKIHGSVLQSVDLNKCKYLLNRSIKPSSKDQTKYCFTNDPRAKIWDLLRWSEDELVLNAHRFSCPILLIKTSKSPFFVKRKDYATKVIDIISKNNTNFEIHNVSGTHHLHLNNPEIVEVLINSFLKKYDIGDRTQSGFKRESLVASSS